MTAISLKIQHDINSIKEQYIYRISKGFSVDNLVKKSYTVLFEIALTAHLPIRDDKQWANNSVPPLQQNYSRGTIDVGGGEGRSLLLGLFIGSLAGDP